MAVDTRAKRTSIIGLGSPWRCHVPEPDGAFDQGDRQALAFYYSGILFGEAVPILIDNRNGTGAANRNVTATGAASRNVAAVGRAPNV